MALAVEVGKTEMLNWLLLIAKPNVLYNIRQKPELRFSFVFVYKDIDFQITVSVSVNSYISLQDRTAILNPLLTCYWLIHAYLSFSLYDLTTVCYRLNSFPHFSHVGGLVPPLFLRPLAVSRQESYVFELPMFIFPDVVFVVVACNSHLSQLPSFVVYSPPLNSQMVFIVN